LSGVFRPLDVLGLELSKEVNNENIQRYLYMLRDSRQLLLSVSAQINDMRTNIAFQAVNPNFSSPASKDSTNYTMSPADFQAALVQQTSTSQAIRNASSFRNKRRSFNQPSAQHQPQQQQFFRSGPSSQQGGYTNNNTNNSSTWHNSKNSHNNNSNNNGSNNNNSYNKQRNSNNPFRNNQQ
jgi:hypothetical protein